jgi:hypothetical protein
MVPNGRLEFNMEMVPTRTTQNEENKEEEETKRARGVRKTSWGKPAKKQLDRPAFSNMWM